MTRPTRTRASDALVAPLARHATGTQYYTMNANPAGVNAMNWDDIGGGVAGAAGGLVRWHQDPAKHETITRKITAAITSVVCGGGFGYLTQSVIEWKLPEVPHSVAVGLAFVAGLASGVLAQIAVTLVSEVIGRLKMRVLDKFLPPPPGPTNGPAPAAGQQQPPAPPVTVGAGADANPVRGVADDQLRATGTPR